MCVGLPGRVIEVEPDGTARVDIQGSVRHVSLALMPEPVRDGDWVAVQLGFAVGLVTEDDAAESVRLLRSLESSVEDALTPV